MFVIGQKAHGRSKVKIQVKFNLEQAMKAQKQSANSYTLYLASVLDVGGWSMQCPSHFNPRKDNWYPLIGG
jgi:hypothetical protein